MRRHLVICCLAAVLMACAHRTREEPRRAVADRPSAASKAAATRIDPLLVAEMALLATAKAATTDPEPVAELDPYIESLLAAPELARVVAPMVIIGRQLAVNNPDFFHRDLYLVASTTTLADGRVLYHFGKPCKASEAAKVRPWWAPSEEVLVCPDAYRPEIVSVPGDLYCGSYFAQVGDAKRRPSQRCGCGPNLIYCAKSAAHLREVRESIVREPNATIEHVVANDLPIDEIFQANETVRDRNVEAVYRRWRVSSGVPDIGVDELASFDGERRAPRFEIRAGQHAGILTTPWALAADTGARPRQKMMYGWLWCQLPTSSHVSTDTILGLGTADLRTGDGWEKLAAMPVCTNCHARLDYGMQFFTGYTFSFAYDGRKHRAGIGKLFGENIADLRGEASLDPHGFSGLALAQPEYSACMASKVVGFVLGDEGAPADVEAVSEAFKARHSFKAMMRVALQRLALRWQERPQGGPTTPGKVSDVATKYCVGCHAAGGRPPNLEAADLPRETLKAMLEEIAAERMPKGLALDPATRDDIVRTFVAALWPDESSRAAALRTFSRRGGQHGVSSVPASLMFRTINARAGVPGPGSVKEGLMDADVMLTPDAVSFDASQASTMALEALRACKVGGRKTGHDLDECLASAMSLRGVVRPRPSTERR